jgi:hypothetical protein
MPELVKKIKLEDEAVLERSLLPSPIKPYTTVLLGLTSISYHLQ